ncbi:MAG: DUF1326 domain-containing protein [Chloroflexota bacterium]|nr:DUF1326 domain-containing protein [Chloroflexota bacterium]
MAWKINGEYFETCSCDYLCPCVTSNLTARPTQGSCTFAFVQHIDQGRFNDVVLDGLNFAIIGRTPEEMAKGNWTVGVITDERANPEQQQAIVSIASGQAGGPIAALSGLIGTFAGIEARAIRFETDGLRREASIPEMLDQALEGMAGANGSEPIHLDNVPHPVNTRLALAHGTRSHVHAFGIDWDNTSGKNNGHYAPFDWQG